MAESYITRKGGGGGPQTELPVITFISVTDTSLTFTIRNEDDEQAIVYYELGDDTPDSASITLNGNTTSSNIVFNDLTPGTSYTLYVWATAFNKSVSQTASNTQSTTNLTVNPTITYISSTGNSITLTVKNNDNTTATIYYEENDNTPDANSIVLNAGQTSSNLTISNLNAGTSYTIYAQAQANGKDLSSVVSFVNSTTALPGQQLFTSSGTFVAPAGVTSVSVVCVGGGSGGYNDSGFGTSRGGYGGSLAWKNNITVVPGQSYSVTVGAGGSSMYASGGASSFMGVSTGSAGYGFTGTFSGQDGGGFGGSSLPSSGERAVESMGGGGAGGYTGSGGNGAYGTSNGNSGTGGGGGGGGNGWATFQTTISSGMGGGVGLLGQGTNGSGGSTSSGSGSGGGSGSQFSGSGSFGGGARARNNTTSPFSGQSGGVRIIWGAGRSFPSTNTGNV
jgi:hypothetical protein